MKKLILALVVVFVQGCASSGVLKESEGPKNIFIEEVNMPEGVTFLGVEYSVVKNPTSINHITTTGAINPNGAGAIPKTLDSAIRSAAMDWFDWPKDDPAGLNKLLSQNHVVLPSMLKKRLCEELAVIGKRCTSSKDDSDLILTIVVEKWGMIKGWGSTMKPYIKASAHLTDGKSPMEISKSNAEITGFTSETPAFKFSEWKEKSKEFLHEAYEIAALLIAKEFVSKL